MTAKRIDVNRKNNILVLGFFGHKTNQLDGQTVKTRNIHKLLSEYIEHVEYFDTQTIRTGLLALVHKLSSCNVLVYLPGQKNLKYIFPFIFFLSKIFRFDIIYPIVGGWLDTYLKGKTVYIWMLKRIKILMSESRSLQNNLQQKYHIDNVCLLPNFRLNIPEKIKARTSSDEFRIVFMARICEDKGIDAIFRFSDHIAIHKLIRQDYRIKINLYGPMDGLRDRLSFDNYLNKYSFIKYCGIVEPEDVYNKLSENDILVLPTHYPGEGMPGSIIEAYIAGLPVVVSRWRFLPEFVDHGKCGFIYDLSNECDFYNYILKFYDNPDLLQEMKKQAQIKGQSYTGDSAWKIMCKYID